MATTGYGASSIFANCKINTKNSVLLVQNSDYIKYFVRQVSGTRPLDAIKDYIIFDSIDTIIEVLTVKEPMFLRMVGESEDVIKGGLNSINTFV